MQKWQRNRAKGSKNRLIIREGDFHLVRKGDSLQGDPPHRIPASGSPAGIPLDRMSEEADFTRSLPVDP